MRVPFIVAASLLILSSAAEAQAPQPVARSKMQARLDADFAAGDVNHDGSLSLAEVQAMEAKDVETMKARVRAQLQATFKQLDTNKDGQLSVQEFLATMASMRTQSAPPQQVIQQYDTNHDGKISAAEYRAPRLAQFDKLDANHDGTLTPAEEAAGSKK